MLSRDLVPPRATRQTLCSPSRPGREVLEFSLSVEGLKEFIERKF